MTIMDRVAEIPMPAHAQPLPADPPRGADTDTLNAWMSERDQVWDANAPTVTQCPEWCTDERLHEWEACGVNQYVYSRTHLVAEAEHAYLERSEYSTKSEHVGWGRFEVTVTVDPTGEFTDAAVLRRVAAEVTTMAHRLEVMQRTTS